jgi:hypothetical protein
MQEDDDEEEAFLTIASPTSVKNIKINQNNQGDLTFESQRQNVQTSQKSKIVQFKKIKNKD